MYLIVLVNTKGANIMRHDQKRSYPELYYAGYAENVYTDTSHHQLPSHSAALKHFIHIIIRLVLCAIIKVALEQSIFLNMGQHIGCPTA
jgi:hypothetical protein